jgi:hypothetical protein
LEPGNRRSVAYATHGHEKPVEWQASHICFYLFIPFAIENRFDPTSSDYSTFLEAHDIAGALPTTEAFEQSRREEAHTGPNGARPSKGWQ